MSGEIFRSYPPSLFTTVSSTVNRYIWELLTTGSDKLQTGINHGVMSSTTSRRSDTVKNAFEILRELVVGEDINALKFSSSTEPPSGTKPAKQHMCRKPGPPIVMDKYSSLVAQSLIFLLLLGVLVLSSTRLYADFRLR